MSAVVREIFKPSVHHAHMLTDSKGPYGLRVEPDSDDHPAWLKPNIVVSQDRIDSDSYLPTLFQMVPHGKHLWAAGQETLLADRLHKRMLADRGIEQPAKPGFEYWRQFHGLQCSATRVINSLLSELYTTVPAERLRIIRRYPISLRSELYRGLCGASDRAWQLADTFPWLAKVVYDPRMDETEGTDGPVKKARALVDRGARLRDVAAAVDLVRVPMALRRFKPAVLRRALRLRDFLLEHPNLVAHHCPDTVPRQRTWLDAIEQATDAGDDFAIWVASHFEQIGKWREVPAIVGDVRDWVRAEYRATAAREISQAEVDRICAAMAITGSQPYADNLDNWWQGVNKNCVGRAFHQNMAPHTVLRLSLEWHERAAKAQAADLPFPEPWYDGDTVNGYCIVPIKTADELSRCGYELHNCASQYSQAVAYGDCCLYVISKGDGKPLAMAEIKRDEKPKLAQLKGPCNQAVPKPLQSAVRTWLTRQKRKHGVGRMPARISSIGVAPDGFCGEIPF